MASDTTKIKAVKVEQWPIANIIPYELNVKKHEKEQVARIVQAIVKSGRFDVPIVVDKNGVIIKGHGRRLAALELGMDTVPVICHRDIGPEEARAMRLSDNRVAISDIDTEMLKVELKDLDQGLLAGIFDAKELDFMGANLGEMNIDAFVEDMDVVIAEQRRDIDERTERALDARVSVAKALGFKDIAAGQQIHVTRLMAKAEEATGLSGADAFTTYLAAL